MDLSSVIPNYNPDIPVVTIPYSTPKKQSINLDQHLPQAPVKTAGPIEKTLNASDFSKFNGMPSARSVYYGSSSTTNTGSSRKFRRKRTRKEVAGNRAEISKQSNRVKSQGRANIKSTGEKKKKRPNPVWLKKYQFKKGNGGK